MNLSMSGIFSLSHVSEIHACCAQQFVRFCTVFPILYNKGEPAFFLIAFSFWVADSNRHLERYVKLNECGLLDFSGVTVYVPNCSADVLKLSEGTIQEAWVSQGLTERCCWSHQSTTQFRENSAHVFWWLISWLGANRGCDWRVAECRRRGEGTEEVLSHTTRYRRPQLRSRCGSWYRQP